MTESKNNPKDKKIKRERFRLLKWIDRVFEIPMIILAFVWIVLLVFEVLKKSNPVLEKISIVIWILFIIDFGIKFIIAPAKWKFLKSNIITLISLFVPFFRVFNILRLTWLLKFTRGIVLLKLLTGVNRGMQGLAKTMEKRAFGFIAIVTVVVLLTGAAGMHAFEKNTNPVLKSYGASVWWTAMVLTTMGTDAWPISTEGRLLALFLAVYAFTIFGYVTATFATFFLGEDAQSKDPEIASGKQLKELQREIKELKDLILKNDPLNKDNQ